MSHFEIANSFKDDYRLEHCFSDRLLASFDAMLCNGGELVGARILKPETVAEVTVLETEGLDLSPGQR